MEDDLLRVETCTANNKCVVMIR